MEAMTLCPEIKYVKAVLIERSGADVKREAARPCPPNGLLRGQIYFQDQQNRKAVWSEVTETNEQQARVTRQVACNRSIGKL
jgi:hypothetical protein